MLCVVQRHPLNTSISKCVWMFYHFKFVTCRIPSLFREILLWRLKMYLIVVIVVEIWLGRRARLVVGSLWGSVAVRCFRASRVSRILHAHSTTSTSSPSAPGP